MQQGQTENLVTLGIDPVIVHMSYNLSKLVEVFQKEFRSALILQMKQLMADCKLLPVPSLGLCLRLEEENSKQQKKRPERAGWVMVWSSALESRRYVSLQYSQWVPGWPWSHTRPGRMPRNNRQKMCYWKLIFCCWIILIDSGILKVAIDNFTNKSVCISRAEDQHNRGT